MEFGVFVGMYHPNHRREAGETEQDVLRAELDVVQAADRSGFKYVWVTEHHFLDEYSHLSANEAWMAYALAITDNIHIGSGIINITPPVCHPARVAEKVAMLDQLAPGRFEFGTGRGSSSVEVLGFGIDSMDTTRDMYDEALPEIVKMMGPDEYGPYDGRVLLAAAPSGAAEAGHAAAPADLGGGGLAGHVREGGAHGHRRAVLQLRRRRGAEAADRHLQDDDRGRRSRRRVREQQRDGHHRDDDAWRTATARARCSATPRPTTTRRWSRSTSTRSRRPPASTRCRR